MNIAGRSDQGQCRTRNEDAFYIPTPGGPQDMILVADGMGGHRGGDVASSTAVQVILEGDSVSCDSDAVALEGTQILWRVHP